MDSELLGMEFHKAGFSMIQRAPLTVVDIEFAPRNVEFQGHRETLVLLLAYLSTVIMTAQGNHT